ncbi:diguanylate cyclase domain-containing protein [Azospirillum sp. B4]|uniref:diguanylate cyclase domain-containing protein n=1 Tax=Azospirillum sp. B4 TaxID=95605 RepID=UPI000A01C99D|nr:diguanylate cyclase [Azospirillum sp. B4]
MALTAQAMADTDTTRPKILVVDDDPLNIRLLHLVLGQQHDVYMATSGEQALALSVEIKPDVILLDVIMPGMDGHEICRRLKANPVTMEIPVIFITAQNNEAEEVRGLELGAVDFIRKPINAVILQARLRTHVTLKRQGDILRTMASVDGLTGVANRRRFEEILGLHWLQSARTGAPLSLILFDVDHFKKYNDHYGHRAGDDCLVRVAGAAAKAMRRPFDLIARYGGEEFACVLPDTDTAGALHIAALILANVAQCAILHETLGADRLVSVSAGIATQRGAVDQDYEALVKAADQQLYRAKADGRNRVAAAPA